MNIVESGMKFIIIPPNEVFHIEKSDLYKTIQHNVKVAEFLILNDCCCFIFEAKTSSPNPNNEENQNDLKFDNYIEEIKDKFVNTLSIYIANRLQRHQENAFNEMSELLKKTVLKTLDFKLILIIKDHDVKWLTPISDALKIKIKGFLKSWNIKDINLKVFNEQLARDKGFIE